MFELKKLTRYGFIAHSFRQNIMSLGTWATTKKFDTRIMQIYLTYIFIYITLRGAKWFLLTRFY